VFYFLRVVDTINRWVGYILAPVVVVIMLIAVYEVIVRYVFNNPTSWAWELNGYLFLLFAAVAGGYTLLHNAHVRMDLVSAHLPVRARAIVEMVAYFFFFLFVGLLLWKGGDMAWSSWMVKEHSSTWWRPPLYPVKMLVPIAAFLLLLQGIARFIRNFVTASTGRDFIAAPTSEVDGG